MSQPLIVYVACSNTDEAMRIAAELVAGRLAACVQVMPPMASIYRWQDVLQESQETLLLIKTTEEKYLAVEKRVTELHSYDTPEIIACPIVAGSEKYLAWLRESTSAAK